VGRSEDKPDQKAQRLHRDIVESGHPMFNVVRSGRFQVMEVDLETARMAAIGQVFCSKSTEVHHTSCITNPLRYSEFVRWRSIENPARIHFLDEAHFVSRNLWRNRGIAPRGKRCIRAHSLPIAQSFSLTLFTTFNGGDNSLTVDLREETNSQWDYLAFVSYLCEKGRIQPDDVLVLDNASIHCGSDIIPHLAELERRFHFTFFFLPTYSPELNPCELVFALIKNRLRNTQRTLPLHLEVLKILSEVRPQEIDSMYHHCDLVNGAAQPRNRRKRRRIC
jgi:transposase